MTVVSSSNNITFAGDGVQILFDFNFRIFKEEDLAAVVRDSSGTEIELVAGSDFKLVSEAGNDSGGRAMYPVSGIPLQTGSSITFYREISYSQELELVDNDPFSAELLNEAFDRGVMRDQQLQEQVARALKYDISTPAEEQLMPQEFMSNVVSFRDAASAARTGAETARTESEAAQIAAEAARTGAETAQTAAEYAKSEAEAIAWGDIVNLRSKTPILNGPVSATEGSTVEVSIADYVADSLTSYEIDVEDFGSAELVGSIIIWTLGIVDVDTIHSVKVVRRRRGEIYSETAIHQLLVKDVLVNDGPTVVFADDSAGWPGAVIDADGIQPPAFSVGATNAKQIVSGKMEVEVASGKRTVLDGTLSTSLKVLEEIFAGDILITDQGNVLVGDVSGGVSSTVNFVPTFVSSAKTDGCTVTASSEYVGYPAWKAVDHDIATSDNNWISNATSSASLTLVFDTTKSLGSYRLTAMLAPASVSAYMPRNWTVETRLTGGEWTQVDSKVDQSDWGASEQRIFQVNFVEAFNEIRINISNAIGGGAGLTEFELFEAPNPYETAIDLPLAPTNVFKNPLQGEKLVITEPSTTSFKTTAQVVENEPLFVDGVDAVAGGVTESEGGEADSIPTMTGETTSGCTITSTSVPMVPDQAPWKVCNGAFTGSNDAFQVEKNTIDLTIQLPTPVKLTSYEMSPRGVNSTDLTRAPKTWTVKGIRADGTRILLDTQTNVTGWVLAVYKTFMPSVVIDEVFVRFELDVTVSGGVGYTNIGHFQIIGKASSHTVDITAAGLTEPPVHVSRRAENIFALGAGITDEYLGPEVGLTLDGGEGIAFSNYNTVASTDRLFATTNQMGIAYTPTSDQTLTSASVELNSTNAGKTHAGVFLWVNETTLGDQVGAWGDELDMVVGKNTFPLPNVAVTSGTKYCVVLFVTTVGTVSIIASETGGTIEAYRSDGVVEPWRMEIMKAEEGTSTTSSIVTISDTSKAAMLYILGGSHNNLLIDGNIDAKVASVSEEIIAEGLFKTTANLVTPLAKVPTSVAIPDRYNLSPSGSTSELTDEKLKLVANKIDFPENPDLKQLAMAVRGPEDMRFMGGKIYIQESI
ncbi:hypothetical protein SAMN05660337_2007 [Maridesulfovibrio ferrireducens]|uniref:F5/8 type C domain-containing protein n=1 Tax=Maridesulfovibrio ferrireducens TaxID=246191 RepID=A0A1G9H4X7_9BACT|nr:hypothetical protein [Maridesulfovibrio ferrireducens]SDL07942.1 hypothetical protein SAMN05660337_2007 [Maridesulfovibrio ferrireducens]